MYASLLKQLDVAWWFFNDSPADSCNRLRPHDLIHDDRKISSRSCSSAGSRPAQLADERDVWPPRGRTCRGLPVSAQKGSERRGNKRQLRAALGQCYVHITFCLEKFVGFGTGETSE